ncbi:NAD(P)/FAD-dependent oxidoreductase [Chitinophaga sp. OAE865]|uniref:NAD(P)/FAD-dependent oxidoreductase n=1 Tax=Chitinophaga sp. OAE865 TaxID=2817898 RepID=UPI001DBA4581
MLHRRKFIQQSSMAIPALMIPGSLISPTKINKMADSKNFDVIIVGGSYAGLSAAMALGRSLRNVLIIDSGLPCNRQTPHSHNFITQDGKTPAEISALAKQQVEKYTTVKFHNGLAETAVKTENGFEITTKLDEKFHAKKLIFATGIKDIMPAIKGFEQCWGISVIHCPYCHGYEVKNEVTGILANGEVAMHVAPLVHNLTKKLTIYTNGASAFTDEQMAQLKKQGIPVVEAEIEELRHHNGSIEQIVFRNDDAQPIKALYAKPAFVQHSDIPEKLGCELTEQGFIKVDAFQKTNVPGVFACGDNTTMMRSVANAVAVGNLAGAMANKEMADELWQAGY